MGGTRPALQPHDHSYLCCDAEFAGQLANEPPAFFMRKAMMITIKRVAKLPDGAFGVMLHLGAPFAVTLERTYGDQVKIPAGTYTCQARRYNKGGYDTFEITGIPGHSLILFHKGNWETDLDGCVAIGESFAKLDGRLAIAQSGPGFAEFMEKVGHLPSFQATFEDC